MDPDISEILKQWEYESSQINARKIIGSDGKVKVQMRLEMGLLQMEADGRPDGKAPRGCESVLEYHLTRLGTHRQREGSDSGFVLDTDDCSELQAEGTQYYYRYLCLFAVGDFERAERDTTRNLRLFDLVWDYAANERDKQALEQYRPYVIMMNARAKASLAVQRGSFDAALTHLEAGIEAIERSLARDKEAIFVEGSSELAFLKSWARQIRQSRPLSLEEQLTAELDAALRREDYEMAARLRDQIRNLNKQQPRR